MTEVADAFYLPLPDGRFEPTVATESPWDPAAQHGGPPSALLANLAAGSADMQPVRVSVDFLGPIPRRPLRVEVSSIRPGRRVALTEATMMVDDRPVATARVWSIIPGAPTPVTTSSTPPPPVHDARPRPAELRRDWGYDKALDWRYTAGSLEEVGPAAVWARARIPLIAGQALTGLDRVLIAADSANAISAELPMAQWLFIPTGLTCHLLRFPEHEWVHLSCRTAVAGRGIGQCTGDLADSDGVIGTLAQPLLVQQR